MEAAILSSEALSGVFNPLAASGKVQTDGSTGLPFSSVLLSQQKLNASGPVQVQIQAQTQDTVQLQVAAQAQAQAQAQTTVRLQVQATAQVPTINAQDAAKNFAAPSALSIDTDQQPQSLVDVTAPATLQQTALAEGEAVSDTDAAVTWVDPAQLNSEMKGPPTEVYSPVAGTSFFDGPKTSEQTVLEGDKRLAVPVSGGGGYPDQYAAVGPAPTDDEVVGAQADRVGPSVVSTTGLSNNPSAASPTTSPSDVGDTETSNHAIVSEASVSSQSTQRIQSTQNTQYASSTETSPVEKLNAQPIHEEISSTELKAPPQPKTMPVEGNTDRGPTVVVQAVPDVARSDRSSAVAETRTVPPADQQTINSREALPVSENEGPSLDGKSELRSASTVPQAQAAESTRATATDKQALSEAKVDRALMSASTAPQQESDTHAIRVTAGAAPAVPSSGQVASIASNDVASSQVKTAMAQQAKRSTMSESGSHSAATDGAEEYHWLTESAEQILEGDAQQPPILNKLPDSAVGGVSTAATSHAVQANVSNDSASLQSFASLKQAVDVAATNITDAPEMSESTSFEIETPVRDAQWSQALSYRVQFMAQQGIQRAQVQLNPTELGPMEITVDLADDVARVHITAEHAATREALEQAVPRLREMMAQSGFADTGVELGAEEAESQSSFADSPLLAQNGSGEGSGASASGRGQVDQPEQTPGVRTLGANASLERTADGRLSFYV